MPRNTAMAEKLAQHEPYLELLTQCGYEVKYLPLPFGHAGTIYKSDLTALALRCGTN